MLQNVGCFKCHFLWVICAGKQRSIFRFSAGARGTGVFSFWVKWAGLEADHSSTSRAKVKNERNISYTPAVCCHGGQRGDLNFT